MDRRKFLWGAAALAVASQLRIPSVWRDESELLLSPESYVGRGGPLSRGLTPKPEYLVFSDNESPVLIDPAVLRDVTVADVIEDIGHIVEPKVDSDALKKGQSLKVAHSVAEKVKNFSNDFSDDLFLSEDKQGLLDSTLARFGRLQSLIGHGHFNIVDFDQALAYAKNYSDVGKFTKAELSFLDEMYETKAGDYGFFGKKVSESLTQKVKKSQVYKVPGSGHYLYRNESLAHYQKLVKDVGDDVILTSGIRANVKQMHLFLAKARSVSYNLSRASRSLAPPGYSFHGIGDYDVGKKGLGAMNFTDDFAESDTFKRMQDLGYVKIRYLPENKLGVRFEPWHIKVV